MAKIAEGRLQLGRVLDAVEENADGLVETLRTVLRQPSVTEDESDCSECAELVSTLIRDAGFQTEVVPASHNPIVVGSSEFHDDRPTLLITGHYDVRPPGPESEWTSPPFAAVLRDGDIIARGACDPKANIVAGIEAARLWREVAGELPINLKFMFIGDEESSVDHGHVAQTKEFVLGHRAQLAADAVLLLDAGFGRDGRSPVHLGTAGTLGLKLSVKTGERQPYHLYGSIIPDAAYRLVWAVASLKDRHERVEVEGFYQHVRHPDAAAEAVLAAMPDRHDEEIRFWGIQEFVCGATGAEVNRRLIYEPTCSIHGLEPDMNRPASDSFIPAHAAAHVTFRLVPNQDPDDILLKVRRHLDAHGFEDVTIEVFRSFAPMAGSADSPLGHALLRGAAHAGVDSYLLPTTFEIGDKWCYMGNYLGVEGALIGIGDPDRRAHMPDEHITVAYYLRGIKWIAASYLEYGSSSGSPLK